MDFRGRESEIEDRGSGIGKSNNNNYKNCRNKYKNLGIYFHVNFYALSSDHLREQFLDYG